MTAAELNEQLRGFTALLEFGFKAEDGAASYTLRLSLAESETAGSRALLVEFTDVSRRSVAALGGGLTQLLHLHVTDVSDRQWDRVGLEVAELERRAIEFSCRSARLVGRYRVGELPSP
jgi:hypothetical protein